MFDFLDCQHVRESEFFRMVDVHFRVDVQQPADQQHKSDHQGRRALFAVRFASAAREGDRHHPQPGLQGGKIRGLYLISLPVVITPGFLAAFCKLRTRYSIDTLFRFVFSENV
jgi:hypothetical protein